MFELKALEIPEIKELLLRAVNDKEKGMGSYNAVLDEDALEFLADMAGGDARSALNAIELGILTTPRASDGKIHITLDVASECIQKRVVRYDKDGDNHYDIISAFIKSMRGSDPDAALHYLARLLEAGGILFGCQERTGTAFHAVPVLIWNQGHDFCHLQVILGGRGQIGPSDGKLGRQPFDSGPIHHAHGALQFIDGRPGGQAVLDGKR